MGLLKYVCTVMASWYHSLKCFNKAIAFLSALLVSRRLVEYGITRMSISYLDMLLSGNIMLSAALKNSMDGLSSILVLVLTHISDAWTGRFRMVLFTSLSSAIGCWLFFIGYNLASLPILVLSLLFLAKYTEAYEITVTAFLGDQLGNQHNPDQVVADAMFWSRLCKVVGTIAVLVLEIVKLVGSVQFKIVATAMSIGFILFLCGFCCYKHKPPAGSPLDNVLPVLKAAHLNLHLEYPNIPTEFYQNDCDELQLTPHMTHFRWLDKAAIIEVCPTISLEEQERRGMVCTVGQVKDVKFLLSVFPMWITFLVYCIISATGDTFYILQGEKMLSSSVDFTILFATQSFMDSISEGLSEFCLRTVQNIWPAAQPRAWKVNTIVGMICGSLSCFSALLVEHWRLQLYNKGEYDKESEIVRMHIYCLFPQFIFMGIMNGLCLGAFFGFYKSQVPESMKNYGPPFHECVLGIGKFFSIFLLVAFMRWFGKTVNDSHLDRYFAVVAFLPLLSLIPFHFFSNLPFYDGAIDHPCLPIQEIRLSENISKQTTTDYLEAKSVPKRGDFGNVVDPHESV